MNSLLFLCTGNYYRSRFAELYFRHLAHRSNLDWSVDSRGLELHCGNLGPLSEHTKRECQRHGISTDPIRMPKPLQQNDLYSAHLIIAVKESEHREMMRRKFPRWEDRVEYWEVHDLDVARPAQTLRELRQKVESLVDWLQTV